MDGVDDLGVLDALQVYGRDSQVRVAQLALDDVQWHALACHLDRVSVPQLVRSEPTPDAGLGSRAPELLAHARSRQRPPAGATVDDAEQRADGDLLVALPGLSRRTRRLLGSLTGLVDG
jgi:hypothetical protein